MKIKCWNKGGGTHIIDIPREFRKEEASGTHNCLDTYEKEVWADVRLRLKDGLYTKVETLLPEMAPLSIEELLQRKGTPIWCQLLDEEDSSKSIRHEEWVIIGKFNKMLRSSTSFQLYPGDGSSWICSDVLYGTHWLAYDRPPK